MPHNTSDSKAGNSNAGDSNAGDSKDTKKCRRLVLCFDGTGNDFQGSTRDTNIVKIYDKLRRDDPDQYHYYQTGIGTYALDSGSVNKSIIGSAIHKTSLVLDSAFGLTFDAHVMAGYRFIMRYYNEGDKIYLFGFSRGAFTARYLARMIHTIGLLSKGNEEMVPFAYKLYQNYVLGNVDHPRNNDAKEPESPKSHESTDDNERARLLASKHQDQAAGISAQDNQQMDRYPLDAFTKTFCRENDGSGVRVYFLGLFDCVGSVSVLEAKAPKPVPIVGTATHIRHAVAVDEHRVKFKAALFDHDEDKSQSIDTRFHKEVWFPGTHCDVGGGWESEIPKVIPKKEGLWTRIWYLFRQRDRGRDLDPVPKHYQMSDIPLSWMLHELEVLGEQPKLESETKIEHNSKLSWSSRLENFKSNFAAKRQQALTARMHDSLVFKAGSSWFKVLLWKFQEILPWVPRIELVNDKWEQVRTWPNFGATRDIPRNALLHHSLLQRLIAEDVVYKPQNNHGDTNQGACLEISKIHERPEDRSKTEVTADPEGIHKLYKFK